MNETQASLLARISNPLITDSANVPKTMANLPFVCVATIENPNGNDNILAALTYSTPDLAFTQYGSLMSYVNQGNENGRFWSGLVAPFGEVASQEDIINFNQSVFGPITEYQSFIRQQPIGTLSPATNTQMWYISPKTAKYLLSVSINPNGNNIYKIFYNSMYNVPYANTKEQILRYCNLVNFSDPQCFCANPSSSIVSIGGAENLAKLQKQDPKSYSVLLRNSPCLNSQCLYSAAQNLSPYAKQAVKQCDPKASVCGSTYITTENFDVVGQISGKAIQEQCDSSMLQTKSSSQESEMKKLLPLIALLLALGIGGFLIFIFSSK